MKGNLIKPFEDMEALALAAMKPLRRMVMCINEAGHDELSFFYFSEAELGSIEGFESFGDFFILHVCFESGDSTTAVDHQQGIFEDGNFLQAFGMNNSAIKGLL